MFKKFLYKAVVLSSFMFILSVATNASATPITTTAEVVGNITITQNTAFNFGQLTVGTGGGTVVFPAGGVVTVTGDVIHLGGQTGGIADLDTQGVTPAGVGTTVTVTVTSPAPLNDGFGNTMAVTPDCLGPAGAPGVGTCTFPSGELAAEQVQIGGTLTVGPNQAVGVYSGTLEVTAAF
jgi:hypothetical protein